MYTWEEDPLTDCSEHSNDSWVQKMLGFFVMADGLLTSENDSALLAYLVEFFSVTWIVLY
jgi:hypothetical protein